MKRTLTKTGTSLVTTMPSAWIRKYGLQKGDNINLEIDGNRLIITTEKTAPPEEEKVTIKQEDCKPYEERVLGKLYTAGYNLVELNISDKSRIEEVKTRIATHELGFEPLEETNKRIIFTSVVTEQEDQYQKFERKAFLTGLETAKLTLQALQENSTAKFEEAENLETTNTKSCNYCERYLNKKGKRNYAFTYVIIWALEKIADEYKYLSQYAKNNKVKASKTTTEYCKEVNQLFRQLYEIYYKFDIKHYTKLAVKKTELLKKGYKLLNTTPQKETPIIMHLMNITRLTNDSLTSNVGKHAKEIVGLKEI